MAQEHTFDRKTRSWRYRVFAATWFSYAGLYFCRKPFYITKAALEDQLGFDASMLGLIGTAYLLAYTVGQFVNGWLGNRFGPRIVLLIGMAVSVGTNVVFGFSNSWATFASFMMLNGLAQATGWSCNVGTMASWFRRKERGTVMGIWATNYQVGGVVANGLAAWVLGAYGFRWSFFAGSAVLMAVWVFFYFNQRNRPEDVGLEPIVEPYEENPDEGEKDARRRHARAEQHRPSDKKVHWPREVWLNVLLVGCFYFFVKFIRYALWSWAPYLLNRHYGLDFDDAGYVSTIFDLAGVAGVIVAGVLSDRLFEGRRAKISFIFILALAASCTLLYTVGASSLPLFALSMGLIGFSLYGPDALMTGAGAIDVGKGNPTLAAGIINGMGSAGSVVQEIVLGAMLGAGAIAGVFGALLISAIAAAACLGWLLVRNYRGKADI